MRFEVLGPLVVAGDDGPLQLRPAHRRLLASLLLEAGGTVPVGILIDHMWGEEPPATARNTLHVHVSALRRDLPDVLTSDGEAYGVDLSGHQLDVAEFTELVDSAAGRMAAGGFRDAGELADRAAKLWRSAPFPELLDVEAARGARDRLVELLVSVRTTHARALNMQGRVSESIALLRQLVVDHPFNESLWEELILAYYLAGRQTDALAAYQEASRTLGEELGIEPGPRLKELEDRVLLHDPDLLDPAATSVPNNLPGLDSSFVGRDNDVAEVLDLVRTNHVVTVIGAPGIGKTRLAVEVGRAALNSYPAGVWIARLAGTRTAQDVAATIASVMEVSERGLESLSDLFRHLGPRPALLILDNCEHVLDAVREFLKGRSHGDRLRVLATSRVRLGVGDETDWPLRALTVPETVDAMWESETLLLFSERVKSADPNIDLTQVDPEELFEVCQKTGGIPLALELTARWMPSLDLKSVAGHTLRSAPALTETDPAHHESVASAIVWSVDMLPPPDRQAFEAASVFASSFTAEAFHSVCTPRADWQTGMEMVSRLVEASLLTMTRGVTGVRYLVLEPLRDFGKSQLTARRTRSIAERHARWFARAVRHLPKVDVKTGMSAYLAECDATIADFRVAMRYLLDNGSAEEAAQIAARLSNFWISRFLGWEGTSWLRESLEHDIDDEHKLLALGAAGNVAYWAAEYDEAVVHAEKALKLATRVGDRTAEGQALATIGYMTAHKGNREEAYEFLRRSIEAHEAAGDVGWASRARVNLGLVAADAGDHETAMIYLTEVVRGADEDHPTNVAVANQFLSVVAWQQGDETTARSHIQAALEMSESRENRRVRIGILSQQAMVEGRWGDPGEAARIALEAVEVSSRLPGTYFPLVGFGVMAVLARVEEWSLMLRLLAHFDRVYEQHGWAGVEYRNASASKFRTEAAARLAEAGEEPDMSPVTTEVIAQELIDTLTRISRQRRHPANE